MIHTTKIEEPKDNIIEENKQAPKRNFSGLTLLPMVLSVVCVLFTVMMAGYVLWFYQGGYQEETAGGTYDRYYIMITQEGKSAFWQSVYQGAYERALEENVYVDWLGSEQMQGYSVEEQMEIAIASGVDGIIVTAGENETLRELIDRAAESGIPVVTLYGDSTQSARCSFVGVGAYNLGREYGRQALKIMKERLTDVTERPIRVTLLVNSYANSLDQNIIYSGIQETIEQERGEAVVEISLQAVDDTNAFSVEESVRDIFLGDSVPDILICLNELNTTCAYQAVVDYNKVGAVSILGQYTSDTILNAIDRNVIYATVNIDTPQMGGFCIDALQEYHDLGYTSQYFTADISLISRENVDEYLRREEPESDE